MNHTRQQPESTSAPGTETADDLAWREAQRRFISLWGQMGSSWGIRRTMAEVHALLYITGRPLNADEVMEGLGISRGNASMALRGLVDWGIVYREHVPGDRKEYYVAEQDVWKLFRTVLRERKKREVDPLLEALHACRDVLAPRGDRAMGAAGFAPHGHDAPADRLDRLIEFVQLVDSIAQRFISPSGQGLQKAASLLARAS
jgi:DNA-binding transcriptional regulator GbsR (MarR family)